MSNKFSTATAIILVMISIVACKQKTTTNKTSSTATMDDSSRTIINRALAYAGGYDAWQQKKTLSFDKKIIMYDSIGNVKRETEQHIDFQLQPDFRAKMTYMRNDTAITLLYDGQNAHKFFNDIEAKKEKDNDGGHGSIFGSYYVMCMPYKLKDPGAKAQYIGALTLTDGTPAQVIKMTYIKSGDTYADDSWYYYFAPSGKLLANTFQGKDSWDFTRYERFEKADGLAMPAERTGYTADTL